MEIVQKCLTYLKGFNKICLKVVFGDKTIQKCNNRLSFWFLNFNKTKRLLKQQKQKFCKRMESNEK